MTVQILQSRPEDVPAVREVVERAYGVYIERIGMRPQPMDEDYEKKQRQGHLLVADDGGVIGLIVLVREPDQLLIENVAVDPCRQGAGVGRALLAHAEAHAREERLPGLRLYTHADMAENLALYRRLGYREDGRDGEPGFERVLLSKRI